MAHVPLVADPDSRRQDKEVATFLPFDGGPQEQAIRSRRVQVHAGAE